MKPQPMSDEEAQALWHKACDHIPAWARHLAFARAIIAARDAQWAAMIGEPVAWRVEVDGLWFHARDRDGLIAALGVKLGISLGDLQPSPLYAIKESP